MAAEMKCGVVLVCWPMQCHRTPHSLFCCLPLCAPFSGQWCHTSTVSSSGLARDSDSDLEEPPKAKPPKASPPKSKPVSKKPRRRLKSAWDDSDSSDDEGAKPSKTNNSHKTAVRATKKHSKPEEVSDSVGDVFDEME